MTLETITRQALQNFKSEQYDKLRRDYNDGLIFRTAFIEAAEVLGYGSRATSYAFALLESKLEEIQSELEKVKKSVDIEPTIEYLTPVTENPIVSIPEGLNENELKTLTACFHNVMDCTGGEFGFTNEVTVEGLTRNQVKGYLGQLVQKGFIYVYPPERMNPTRKSKGELIYGQFELKSESLPFWPEDLKDDAIRFYGYGREWLKKAE